MIFRVVADAFGKVGVEEMKLVPSEINIFPLVPATVGNVGVEAIQFVPSDLINLPDVAEAFGKVGVLQEGVVLEPDIKTLFAVAVPARIAPAEAVE